MGLIMNQTAGSQAADRKRNSRKRSSVH
jgi:hypothetical protein